MATPDDEMPEGFSRSEDGKSYANGFAFAGLKDLPAGVVNVTPQAGDVLVRYAAPSPIFALNSLFVLVDPVEPGQILAPIPVQHAPPVDIAVPGPGPMGCRRCFQVRDLRARFHGCSPSLSTVAVRTRSAMAAAFHLRGRARKAALNPQCDCDRRHPRGSISAVGDFAADDPDPAYLTCRSRQSSSSSLRK